MKKDQLIINKEIYLYLYDILVKEKDTETKCKYIRDLAYLLWVNHSGIFYDGRLENLLIEIGQNLVTSVDNEYINVAKIATSKMTKKKSLYVATKIFNIGGHNKVIEKFIIQDNISEKVLLLTEQIEEIPIFISDAAKLQNVEIIILSKIINYTEKAAVLREISKLFDVVFLFIHPYDITPIIAFAVADTPPVLFENHSHFNFWLGVSISDIVTNHNNYMQNLSITRRNVSNNYYFPMLYSRYKSLLNEQFDKNEIKQKLNIDNNICFLTIASEDKLIPNNDYNFFKILNYLAVKFPNSVFNIIGIDNKNKYVKSYINKDLSNIHFLGIIENPIDYYMSADIYLDSMPKSSLGAVLEAVLIGEAIPVFSYSENTNLFSGEILFRDVQNLKAKNITDYYNLIDEVYLNKEKFKNQISDYKKEIISYELNFVDNLEKLYKLNENNHIVKKIPLADFQTTNDDLNLIQSQKKNNIINLFEQDLLILKNNKSIEMIKEISFLYSSNRLNLIFLKFFVQGLLYISNLIRLKYYFNSFKKRFF